LASLDVVSLFTNVQQVTESVEKNGKYSEQYKENSFLKKNFFVAIKLVLEHTYFSFNKRFYRQIFGSPIDSPLSPTTANIVMEDLEEKAFQLLSCRLLFYFRYVDDFYLLHQQTV